MLRNFPAFIWWVRKIPAKFPSNFPPNFPPQNQKNPPTSFCRSAGRNIFPAGQKTSKIIKKCRKIFFGTSRQFSRGTSFPAPFFQAGSVLNERMNVLKETKKEVSTVELTRSYDEQRRDLTVQIMDAKDSPALGKRARLSASEGALQADMPLGTTYRSFCLGELFFLFSEVNKRGRPSKWPPECLPSKFADFECAFSL